MNETEEWIKKTAKKFNVSEQEMKDTLFFVGIANFGMTIEELEEKFGIKYKEVHHNYNKQ